jgi:uncharacterized protein (DUF1697 family)
MPMAALATTLESAGCRSVRTYIQSGNVVFTSSSRSKPKSPDINGITKLAISSERFQLIDCVFYLHAPDGFGRSKLAAGAERKLGVPLTARNYTTIHNLSEMLDAD